MRRNERFWSSRACLRRARAAARRKVVVWRHQAGVGAGVSRGVSAWLDASVIAGGDIRDSRTFCPLLR
jgi:hypothetical protein